ncbi:MAG: helix-turn-helix domain-containing protein [Gammaproteobacteria bacterium]
MPTAERELITTAEAAERLACHISTVARLVRTGKLSYARRLPGERGDYLFDPAEVAELARERLAGARKALELAEADA